MYFEKVSICNYGPLPDSEYEFSQSGINIIVGANDSGKTQLVGAIIAALMGSQQIRLMENYTDKRPSRIELSIRENNRGELISLTINNETKTEEYNKLIRYSEVRHQDSLQDILIKHLIEPKQPLVIFNPNDEFSLAAFAYESYSVIDKFILKNSIEEEIWERIKAVFVSEAGKSNQLERLVSEGQRKVLRLAQEYINRKNCPYPLPLILDTPFSFLDTSGRNLSLKIVEAIAESNQVILLTQIPDPMLIQLATKHYLLPPHKQEISPIYYNYGNLKKTASPKPYIVTEGKTDWKHIKAALFAKQSHREYKNIDVEFVEHDETQPMGSAELLKFCEQSSKLPQPRPIICIFDRDEDNIIKKVMADNNPKDWGNNVYSFIIPLPPHRTKYPDICIEFYYQDKDIMRFDSNNRRLFISDEFDPRSGRHIKENLNCTTLNKLGRYTIIDNNVFDTNNNNVALSKDGFASAILNQVAQFNDIDFTCFDLVFRLIQNIAKQHDSEY